MGALPKRGAHFFGIVMAGRISQETKPATVVVSKQKESRKQRISKLLSSVEANLDFTKSKVTLADFIRLTQLERELEEEEQPREIIVTWKDPAEERCE